MWPFLSRHVPLPLAVVGLMVAGLAPAAAEDTCWTAEHGQFFNAMKYCVSSVLPADSAGSYGPENLLHSSGGGAKAWCEGPPGFGLGQTIRIDITGGPAFRRLLVANGYAKTPATFADYARIKTVEITGDNGLNALLDFPDRSDLVTIPLPKMPQAWILLKIVDVYPGRTQPYTCLGFLVPDFEYEEELLLRKQGLIK